MGREKSQSKKVLYLLPQQRMEQDGKDAARMGSECPVRASEPQDSSHHPFPTHCAASPPSLLSSPQAGAFNYSCPPLQPVHAGLLPSAFSCAGWEAPAAFPACWLWSGAGEPCREVELPGFFPVPCTGDLASPQRSRGWRQRCPGSPGRCPAPLPHTPVIILSITFINTLHSAGFFHTSWWEFSMRCVFPAAVRAVIQRNYI